MIVIIFIDCICMVEKEATAEPCLRSNVFPPQNFCRDICYYSESDWRDGAIPACCQPSLPPVPNSLGAVLIAGGEKVF